MLLRRNFKIISNSFLRIPASYFSVETDDKLFFLFGETSMFDVRPQIVQPS